MSQASKTQFFARFLAVLAGWPHFRLAIGQVSLTVSPVIGKAKLMSGEVAASFSGYFL